MAVSFLIHRFTMQACPCGRTAAGRSLDYARCCGRFIDDYLNAPAPDPESLMRSRYTAFVLERERYVLDTWHPDTRPPVIEFEAGVKWLGLTIRAVTPPVALDGDTAWVEYVARSRLAGRGHRLHERSRFLRQNGRWFYIDGQIYD